jgi:hypothetical protein
VRVAVDPFGGRCGVPGGGHDGTSTAIGILGRTSLTVTVTLIPGLRRTRPGRGTRHAARGTRHDDREAVTMSGQPIPAAPTLYRLTKTGSRISDWPLIAKTLFFTKTLRGYSMINLREK